MISYKNRPIIEGQRVFVYYNLHKHLFSVKSLEGETKGKIIAHTKEIMLENCIFQVNEKNRLRVIETCQKNVHAGIVGNLSLKLKKKTKKQEITYNPYLYASFVDKYTKIPIYKAEAAYLTNKKIFI